MLHTVPDPVADADVPVPPGLRERKKQRMRDLLSDTATGLFMERGFEAVTIAEIAAACDVSPGTIFNYFPTKEDLFYDRIDEVLDRVCEAITTRPAGTTVTEAVAAAYATGPAPLPGLDWSLLRDPDLYAQFAAWRRVEAESPSLAARRMVIYEQWTVRIAETLRRELALSPRDPAADAIAVLLLSAIGLRDRVLTAALLEGASAREVRRRVRVVAQDAFARVGRACADVDPPR